MCIDGERPGCILCELGTTGTEQGYKKGKELLAFPLKGRPHPKAMTTTLILEWMVALCTMYYWYWLAKLSF